MRSFCRELPDYIIVCIKQSQEEMVLELKDMKKQRTLENGTLQEIVEVTRAAKTVFKGVLVLGAISVAGTAIWIFATMILGA